MTLTKTFVLCWICCPNRGKKMLKCSSGKFLLKGATACHKICVPDPPETSCSSCSHSQKITVIYKFTAVYTCTKCTLFCWQKCTVKCEYTCTYSGIRIRMPITTIGMRISKTVPIGLRFCWHYQEYTYILLQWYKPFINSQNLYALSIGC